VRALKRPPEGGGFASAREPAADGNGQRDQSNQPIPEATAHRASQGHSRRGLLGGENDEIAS